MGSEIKADFSRICKGCEHVVTEDWTCHKAAYRCFASGSHMGRVIGQDNFPPYIPAWCPKLIKEREVSQK